MTDVPTPLSLPTDDWEGWLAARCDGQLDEARRLVDVLKAGGHDPAAAMAVWNDLNLALHNAFASASLLSNVHPEETVRSRGEQAEQDAHRLLTEIGLDRGLYEALAGVDPQELDEGGRRVHSLAIRDFHRAGVDQDEQVRARLRELAERETAVGPGVLQEHPRRRPLGLGRPGRARRAARRLRRGPPGRRGRPGHDHHRLPRLPAVHDLLPRPRPPGPR